VNKSSLGDWVYVVLMLEWLAIESIVEIIRMIQYAGEGNTAVLVRYGDLTAPHALIEADEEGQSTESRPPPHRLGIGERGSLAASRTS